LTRAWEWTQEMIRLEPLFAALRVDLRFAALQARLLSA
jgi:hypothetical protein